MARSAPKLIEVYVYTVRREMTVTIVGAGIVGLAIAREFATRGFKVTVLEREAILGAHQTGRNSGVIHAGPYYKPGSLKAEMCVSGGRSLKRYARDKGLPLKTLGKLIVATEPSQNVTIDAIHQRAAKNGVDAEIVGRSQIVEQEPACVAEYGLHVKETGVIDYVGVAWSFKKDIENLGGEIKMCSSVFSVRNIGSRVEVSHGAGEEVSDLFVNAGGLQSDRIARLAGLRPSVRIIPFKGQYFDVNAEKSNLVRGMIYPAPNPQMPFLGVHLTKSIDGRLHAGPNAFLAMGRQAYETRELDIRDLADVVMYPAFWRFAFQNYKFALKEGLRAASRGIFVKELSKIVEGVTATDLTPAKAGIRAQAMNKQGQLVDDFVIERNGNQIHILNAPSPAATACLAIAQRIVDAVHADSWN